ncbi:MAG: hypothetical protein U1E27_06045, partial [Kiritimatiellia bacterium]|nr:hypothetical protein [Kiritimatiellia bacterium]
VTKSTLPQTSATNSFSNGVGSGLMIRIRLQMMDKPIKPVESNQRRGDPVLADGLSNRQF